MPPAKSLLSGRENLAITTTVMRLKSLEGTSNNVIPAKAGIQTCPHENGEPKYLDSRFRGNDKSVVFRGALESLAHTILLFGFLFICTGQAVAYDDFHPEARKTLEEENIWTRPLFKKNDTAAKSIFRIWYPYPADEVWKVLTDTNRWKNIHAEYTDSRTLDKNIYEELEKQKPDSIKKFYAILGNESFPSDLNRVSGRVWTSYVFQRFNLPWPFMDRWVVIRIKNDESNARQGFYRYEYKMNVGNFDELKGYWELVPIPGHPGWTEFRGEYKSDLGFQVPQFLTKTIFRSSMKRARNENLRVLEKDVVVKKTGLKS